MAQNRRRIRRYTATVTIVLAGLATIVASLAQSSAEKWWPGYGNGPDNSRYFASRQIDKTNVNQLQVAWTYAYGDTSFGPIVVRGVIYGRGRNGSLVAVDAKTGKEQWIRENMNGMTSRGMNYWESTDGRDQRLIFADEQPAPGTGCKDGEVDYDLRHEWCMSICVPAWMAATRPRSETFNRTLQAKFSKISSFWAARQGKATCHLPETFVPTTSATESSFGHSIPYRVPANSAMTPGPSDAWKYVGGNNNWGEMTIDTGRGIAYIPLGSPTYDFYGADRRGANLFGTSIVALDARTGKRKWHFQLVHHDLWDMDPSAAPQLTTIRHNGTNRDVVVVSSKLTWLYVLDRETGEPVWPDRGATCAKVRHAGRRKLADTAVSDQPAPAFEAVFHCRRCESLLVRRRSGCDQKEIGGSQQ